MTTSVSIHPGGIAKPGSLKFTTPRPWDPDNGNSLRMDFCSNEYYDRTGEGIFQHKNEISVFDLSATDAEILSSVGLLDAQRREALLPVLRHMLEEMSAEEEVAADA